MKSYLLGMNYLLAVALLLTATSCNNDPDDSDCPGDLQASWKFNGVQEESHKGHYAPSVALMSLSFIACKEGTNDKSLSLAFITYPPQVGSYPLLIGPSVSGVHGLGTYSADVEGDFQTDSVHNGVLIITEVDLVAKTLSGSFEFDAKNVDNPSQTISITEGQIFNIQYE